MSDRNICNSITTNYKIEIKEIFTLIEIELKEQDFFKQVPKDLHTLEKIQGFLKGNINKEEESSLLNSAKVIKKYFEHLDSILKKHSNNLPIFYILDEKQEEQHISHLKCYKFLEEAENSMFLDMFNNNGFSLSYHHEEL